ncbi:hypothetical protein PF010_g31531 [Phytophthora fragariae]|uniref:Secreted protein n=1 Tax=Phytophthora fragariae TaxID=53985 RepID=A0A6A3PCV0_9STRA|nr:hypothetical protein PF009_g30710 [Phytophthora fragariae]KAE9057034.1 hypothetical protein PF010_g31531 [Phytophthora fragariae]KAE9057882.1 hypothetical protein PF007_g31496 [Phytophthora fragariae]KAE9160418.1 hypothetical protein PF004_g31188 [Phytophthora fragariae]KAE9162843.1 hypothetical protein PF002_g32005 [Phytophthora fragariae]
MASYTAGLIMLLVTKPCFGAKRSISGIQRTDQTNCYFVAIKNNYVCICFIKRCINKSTQCPASAGPLRSFRATTAPGSSGGSSWSWPKDPPAHGTRGNDTGT